MNLKIKLIIIFIFFLSSCTLDTNKKINTNLINDQLLENKNEKVVTINNNNNNVDNLNQNLSNKPKKLELINHEFPKYYLGKPYEINGIKYIPQENYFYNQTGLASYYDKELHNKKTINNELNKVTELFARHKTLPIPSVVKLTNLENGLYLIVRVNDRMYNNSLIIEVSRKTAQLLRFYKSKFARVRVEILSEPSKQLKRVVQTMNNPDFITTITSAPTEIVNISDLDENIETDIDLNTSIDQPIELGFEEIPKNNLYLIIGSFKSYSNIQKFIKDINQSHKYTTQKNTDDYSVNIGPLTNEDADKLFQFLVSKGYNDLNIIVE